MTTTSIATSRRLERARQVIHHIADSEAQSYARPVACSPNGRLGHPGLREAAWAECPQLGYVTCPWCTARGLSRPATRVTGRARTDSRGRPRVLRRTLESVATARDVLESTPKSAAHGANSRSRELLNQVAADIGTYLRSSAPSRAGRGERSSVRGATPDSARATPEVRGWRTVP